MKWCERCGQFYIVRTGKKIRGSVRRQGPGVDVDISPGVCLSCLKPGEMYDAAAAESAG